MPHLPTPDECRRIFREEGLPPNVIAHVEAVAALAGRVAGALKNRGENVDIDLVEVGALVHDIGRSKTQGIDHATVGAEIVRRRGLPEALALCVERHTGGGIDAVEAANLGLPVKDYNPKTLEEKLVCHIDNLFDGNRRHPVADELRWLRSKGLERVAGKVQQLHDEISALLGRDLDQVP